MKTSIFAAAATLLFATFVAASPAPVDGLATTPKTLKPRCEACDEACPRGHFYYSGKKCCLRTGGPQNPPPNPPKDRGCPKDWYWNDDNDKQCCTPKYPPPQNNPPPTCGSSTFPWWDRNNHCCKKPPTGTNPPPPGGSPHANKRDVQPKSKYTGRKAVVKNRQTFECLAGMYACPMGQYGSGTIECLESFREIHACGGCPAFGVGQDCAAIPNSVNVGCDVVTGNTPSCVVTSCKDGFTPSKDAKSCVAE